MPNAEFRPAVFGNSFPSFSLQPSAFICPLRAAVNLTSIAA
jgi:hypothetical protein